ncbi:hypothetical protein AaE_012161 [Aphanomyces astaci]|uniref:Uncharacterized protein n=1 Tax=Aphanomyces astaci TaxID=112090 RepID=A0A6A4ZKI9_APHAT|nr:hypothetical protein AaE_012161 [Aphanomyces astaci]
MRIEVSGKENCPEPTHDAFSWITPVVLEDGWLDKMDSSVEGEFFPDLSWSDSPSDPFFHATSVVDETPPAKKLTSEPHAKPTSKKAKGDALRSLYRLPRRLAATAVNDRNGTRVHNPHTVDNMVL